MHKTKTKLIRCNFQQLQKGIDVMGEEIVILRRFNYHVIFMQVDD